MAFPDNSLELLALDEVQSVLKLNYIHLCFNEQTQETKCGICTFHQYQILGAHVI